jgi:hypothetical protein
MAQITTHILYGFNEEGAEAISIIHPSVGLERWLKKNDYYQLAQNPDALRLLEVGELVEVSEFQPIIDWTHLTLRTLTTDV